MRKITLIYKFFLGRSQGLCQVRVWGDYSIGVGEKRMDTDRCGH